MFSCTHSFLLVLLVITCFHSYTAGNDEFMTQFCLNMDTAEHMDSSTVQGRKNSTHVSYLATKSPVQQDYTEEQLHTVTSHGIANDSQQLREAQEDPDPIREGQEDPHPITEAQEDPHPIREGQEDTHPIREGQEDPHPITEGQEDPHPITEGQEDPHPITEAQEDQHPVRKVQEDPHPFRKGQKDPHPVRKVQEDPHTFREGQEKEMFHDLGFFIQVTKSVEEILMCVRCLMARNTIYSFVCVCVCVCV
ncbi:uncharacterized protein LOC128610557 isoform X2 [Ictalurus furcatus]|nr:uncharacterized protein LOC128610557 isoform X2 [Ictalurus furcatus]